MIRDMNVISCLIVDDILGYAFRCWFTKTALPAPARRPPLSVVINNGLRLTFHERRGLHEGLFA